MQQPISIFWFRRDLRLEDNTGLYHALQSGQPVLPIFIFDQHILSRLPNKKDRRLSYIHDALIALKADLEKVGSSLLILHGDVSDCFRQLLASYPVQAVYTNRDYEPYARERDQSVEKLLLKEGIPLRTYKDQVIFEMSEIVKDDQQPYTVFTPYSKKWKSRLVENQTQSFPSNTYPDAYYQTKPLPMISLENMGFEYAAYDAGNKWPDDNLIKEYHLNRNHPAKNGISRMSVHLRFGTVSIRRLCQMALATNESYLNELIWREFYQQILYHFPHLENHCFKSAYENIPWNRDEQNFEKWCKGQTGIPLVDAGMRELMSSGFMHNRVRMVCASFLTKNLLIDWRWGQAWFAENLLDYDLAANNGGWQWSAGCGTDAAPYFRIFNPLEQQRRFDPHFTYIKAWVSEIDTANYPLPIVDLAASRNRCLSVYKEALEGRTSKKTASLPLL